jgi:hypothetical protein
MKSTRASRTSKKSAGAPRQLPCPECGMERSKWPDEGYVLANKQYCCQGCAEGTGCTCPDSRERASA